MAERKIRVLIVDESRHMAEQLAQVLERFKIVGIATDGKEALYLNTKQKPDVIAMDINLADLDSAELTRQILAERPVTIIMVCDMGSPELQASVTKALRAGACNSVAKSRVLSYPSSPAAQKLVGLIQASAPRINPKKDAVEALSY